MEIETLSFEEAYAQLEAAVNALRDGQMPLERALHYYEEGMSGSSSVALTKAGVTHRLLYRVAHRTIGTLVLLPKGAVLLWNPAKHY